MRGGERAGCSFRFMMGGTRLRWGRWGRSRLEMDGDGWGWMGGWIAVGGGVGGCCGWARLAGKGRARGGRGGDGC